MNSSNGIRDATNSKISSVANSNLATLHPDVSDGEKSAMPRFAADKAQCPESLRIELVRSFTRFERSFRRNYPLLWILTFAGPAIFTVALLVMLGLINGWDYPSTIISHAVMTFFIFGRFVIMLGMPDSQASADQGYDILLSPGELFAMVTYMDVMVALFVTFHMGVIFRLPKIGEKIAALVYDGKFIVESQPWIRRMSFLGLVLFVVFPTSTTGSIGGSIFGRLLGLSRWMTVAGVMLGSVLGNAIMYAFSKQINHFINPNHWWLKVAGGLILVGIFILLEIRYQRVKKKYFATGNSKPDNQTEQDDGERPGESDSNANAGSPDPDTHQSVNGQTGPDQQDDDKQPSDAV